MKEFATGKYGDLQSEDVDALLWSFLPEEALEDAVKASESGAALKLSHLARCLTVAGVSILCVERCSYC
ncbi:MULTISPECIES: hypothetical protein [unclassified Mesorhizobium]|uniref:hypothetical protein n=1 Tax=unclassified Mesorhizobium TaxID=325217 RepID=UPI00333DF59F